MRISGLIKKLEEVKKEYGDLNVSCSNSSYWHDLDEKSFGYIFDIETLDNGEREINICTE